MRAHLRAVSGKDGLIVCHCAVGRGRHKRREATLANRAYQSHPAIWGRVSAGLRRACPHWKVWGLFLATSKAAISSQQQFGVRNLQAVAPIWLFLNGPLPIRTRSNAACKLIRWHDMPPFSAAATCRACLGMACSDAGSIRENQLLGRHIKAKRLKCSCGSR